MSSEQELVHLDIEDQYRLTLAQLQLRLEGITELPTTERSELVECVLGTAFVVGARFGRHLERRVADRKRGSE